MIPWFGPHFTGEESTYLNKALDSGWINDGPLTRELEDRFAEFIDRNYAVAVPNCTSALALCLMAVRVGPADEVIVPDLTFAATANAVTLAGAKVRLVDVREDNFTIDPALIKQAITDQTRAVIAVDVNGRGCDWSALEAVCFENRLELIYDCAEALGSSYGASYMGTHGRAACFSFSANKTISAGQGGMIVTDSAVLWNRLRQLKDQGRVKPGTGGDDDHPTIGFNFKFTDLQAAVALAQWEQLAWRLGKAEARDDYYHNAIGSPGSLPGEVLQWSDILLEDREKVTAALDAAQIGYRRFWKPLHTQLPYKDDLWDFPVSTEISRKGLWLPSRYDLTETDLRQVCEVISDVLQQERAA